MDDDSSSIFCESLPDDYIPDIPNLRQSLDSGTVDLRGSSLIELCTENNFRILNGRLIRDSKGKKTSFQHNGSSLVDYVIVNQNLLQKFQYIKVHDLKPHLSDHCQLSYSIKVRFSNQLQSGKEKCVTRTYKKLICNDEAILKVPKLLKESYTEKLTNLFWESKEESTNIDSLVNKFTKIVHDLSLKAGFRYS